MPFVVISDPIEAHRYRQAGMLWFYSCLSERCIALNSEESRERTLECQTDYMRELPGARYAILVERED